MEDQSLSRFRTISSRICAAAEAEEPEVVTASVTGPSDATAGTEKSEVSGASTRLTSMPSARASCWTFRLVLGSLVAMTTRNMPCTSSGW